MDMSAPFSLFVTNVSKEYGLVKIYGQTDVPTGEVVEKYLAAVRDQLEGGLPPHASQLTPGQSVIARYEGTWYRAKILSVVGSRVSLLFVDYGQTEVCGVGSVRTGLHSQLQAVPPLAQEFVLAEVVPPAGDWSKPAIEFVKDALMNDICRAIIIHRSQGYNFIRVYKRDKQEPLVMDMVQCGMAVSGYPNMENIPPAHNYTAPPRVLVPPLQQQQHHHLHQSMSPSYPPPASPNLAAVFPQPRAPASGRGAVMSPVASVEVWNNGNSGANSTYGSQAPPSMQPPPPPATVQHHPTGPTGGIGSQGNSSPHAALFRPIVLQPTTSYSVYISANEAGPADFSVQLASHSPQLEQVMADINSCQLRKLPTAGVQVGTACLARYTVDSTIYRAVILQRSETVKVLYLDFGNSEYLPADQLYDLPPEYSSVPMLSIRCCLYNWPDLQGNARQLAKQRLEIYADRPLNCRLVSTQPGLGFGVKNIVQLYEDSVDIGQELRLWIARQQTATKSSEGGNNGNSWRLPDTSQWQLESSRDRQPTHRNHHNTRGPLAYVRAELSGTVEVFMSYIGKGPSRFYVQQAANSSQLEDMMEEIAGHVATTSFPLPHPRPGTACLAQYTDQVWYRGRLESFDSATNKVKVDFVDFGNSDEVRLDQVRAIPANLVTCLPAQAVPCRLSGLIKGASEPRDPNAQKSLFEELLKDQKFRVRVESVGKDGVCVVQATTLDRPPVSINRHLTEAARSGGGRSGGGSSSSVSSGPMQLIITHFSSSNLMYGQPRDKTIQRESFFTMLADYCQSYGNRLYSGHSQQNHCGEICALPDTSKSGRFYRSLITREQKSTIDLKLLDVGGTDRVEKNVVIALPEELQQVPEFGVELSLGLAAPLADPRLRNLVLHATLEVQEQPQQLSSAGPRIVRLTRNTSPKLANAQVLRLLQDVGQSQKDQTVSEAISPLTDHNQRLNSLYERQNSKREAVKERQVGRDRPSNSHKSSRPPPGPQYERYQQGCDDGGGGRVAKQRTFERGDLRHSLRERRAAREVTLAKPVTSAFRSVWLKEGWSGRARITWMYDPSHFYFQVIGDEGQEADFEAMMAAMQAEFQSGPYEARSWPPGSPVAAKFRDNCWYRAKVESQKGKSVDVFFVDFGNTDRVDTIDVVGLPAEFGALQTQAIRARLADLDPLEGRWDHLEAAGGFGRHFSAPAFDFEIIATGGREGCLIRLNGGQVAADLLRSLREGSSGGSERKKRRRDKESSSSSSIAAARNSEHEEEPTRRGPQPGKKLATTAAEKRRAGKYFLVGNYPSINSKELVGSTGELVVSHFISWKQFWVQWRPEEVSQVAALIGTADQALLGPLADNLKVGERCVVEQEGVWYRGLLEEIKDDSRLLVHCPDYGFTCTVEAGGVRVGHESVYTRPPAAVRCKLDHRLDTLHNLLQTQNNRIKLRFRSFFKNQFVVKLDKSKADPNSMAVNEMPQVGQIHDKKSKKEERKREAKGDPISVCVTHVESVRRIWVVEEANQEALNDIMSELAALRDSLQPILSSRNAAPAAFEKGKLYAAEYGCDGDLYRVKVIADDGLNESSGDESSKTVEVEYIDYGNREEVDACGVLALPPALAQLRAMARPVTIRGTKFALDSEEARERLRGQLTEGSVQIGGGGGGREADNVVLVDGQPLNLPYLFKFKGANLNLFRECGSVRLSCYITSADPAGHIWIIEKSMLSPLETMMKSLQTRVRSFRKLGKVSEGRLACCKFSQDNSYYRVKIGELLDDNKVWVYYIDFGNREIADVNSILELGEEFRLHPGYAMKVEVDNTGECRMLAPGEVEEAVSQGLEMVAELIQPRMSIVRLYQGGRRVGFQCLGEQPGGDSGDLGSSNNLPPARLRLNTTRLALTTLATTSSIAIQDLSTARAVGQLIANYSSRLDPVVGLPELGRIYLAYLQGTLQRLAITAADSAAGQVTGKLLDSLTTACLAVDQLRHCPDQLLSCPPAAVSATSLTLRTKDRYQLAGRLLLLSVSGNCLKLSDLPLGCSLTSAASRPPKVTLRGRLPNLEALVPAGLGLSADLLDRIRNWALGAAVVAAIMPAQDDQEEEYSNKCLALTENDLLTASETGEASPWPLEENVFLSDTFRCAQRGASTENCPHQEAWVQLQASHPGLLKAVESNGKVQRFDVPVQHMSNCRCLLLLLQCPQAEELRTKLAALANPAPPPSFNVGDLVVYKEQEWERAIIVKSDWDLVSLYLMDRGSTRLATAPELFGLPDDISTLPVIALPVITTCSKKSGEVEGLLSYSNNRLEFSPASHS